mgnify:CR=1 FL=1
MPPRVFDVTICAMDWYYLKNDTKSFIVIAELSPGLHYGDILRLKYPGSGDILERWVKYAESGIHLLPNSVAIELATGKSPKATVHRETCLKDS